MGQVIGIALRFCKPAPQGGSRWQNRADFGARGSGSDRTSGVIDGYGDSALSGRGKNGCGSGGCSSSSNSNSSNSSSISGGGGPARSPLAVAYQQQHQPPRTILDCEQDTCYSCTVRFDVLTRRHHCRRCRNIFCGKCSSHTDRVLMFGENNPVRLCHSCAEVAPAENHFIEWHVPLLLEGTTLVRKALLARRSVFIRVTADLSALEETEAAREGGSGGSGEGTTRHHPLDEVESVVSAGGGDGVRGGVGGIGWRGGGGSGWAADDVPALLVIRLKGKGQLKLEVCNPSERDLWVTALGEAVRRQRTPPLATEVEEERWARKEKAEHDVRKAEIAEKRLENEASRARMATKYGLDPKKYASRQSGTKGSADARDGRGSGSVGSSGGTGDVGGFVGGGVGGMLKRPGLQVFAAMAR